MTRAPTKAVERRFAEDHEVGARLAWPAPPAIRDGAATVPAPSVLGRVSWVAGGVAFVRFYLNGRSGEPREVVRGQPCEQEAGW